MSSIFTRIASGETPGHIIWQDELCLSILTIQPIREGHSLVIPREEIDHWIDVPENTAAHLFTVSQRIGRVLKAEFRCKKVGLMIAGLEVPHTHIHLLPVDNLEEFNFGLTREADPEDLARVADRIRRALRDAGHQEAQ